jgi:hypothetical protein
LCHDVSNISCVFRGLGSPNLSFPFPWSAFCNGPLFDSRLFFETVINGSFWKENEVW